MKSQDSILLKGARLIDPAEHLDAVGDILIEDGVISSIKRNISPPVKTGTVDCTGYVICPSFCDAHVHLRTPGQQRKENIVTGCRAASRGGVTSMVTMPNTKPPIDTPSKVASIIKRYRAEGNLDIDIAGAITIGEKGTAAADWEGMRRAGAVALTDDGRWVKDDKIMRDVLLFSANSGIPVMSHAEDASLHNGGCVNKGKISRLLKVKGISWESEVEAIKRDIHLARETGGRLHIQHISTSQGVGLIRKAKGVKVTCEATPHHLLLTEEAVLERGALAKMNPPLRTEKDRQALIEGIVDGTIDIIATDHAPHTKAEKRMGIVDAPFGVTGLETMFASVHTGLVVGKIISLSRLIGLICHKPRALTGLERISLKPGSRADLVVFDPAMRWTVREDEFAGRGKNSAFIGMEFTGKIMCTMHKGKIVYSDESVLVS